MNHFRRLPLPLLLLGSLLLLQPKVAAQLTWDALEKGYMARRDETNAVVVFNTTNSSPDAVIVSAVRPSCHCTVAKVPTLPWKILPGAGGQMEVTLDLAGKWGQFVKTIAVETDHGTNLLRVNVDFPPMDAREKNRMRAFADRQAVFKTDCASCHLQPAVGKMGGELYRTICGICHDAEHRAQMVPDLATLKHPVDAAFWEQSVRMGKPGTFMPAFATRFGGPLTDEQIASVVAYLVQQYPSNPLKQLAPPAPGGGK